MTARRALQAGGKRLQLYPWHTILPPKLKKLQLDVRSSRELGEWPGCRASAHGPARSSRRPARAGADSYSQERGAER